MASQKGHISVVKLLLEARARTDIQGKVIFGTMMTVTTFVWPTGCTEAVSHDHGQVIERLRK